MRNYKQEETRHDIAIQEITRLAENISRGENRSEGNFGRFPVFLSSLPFISSLLSNQQRRAVKGRSSRLVSTFATRSSHLLRLSNNLNDRIAKVTPANNSSLFVRIGNVKAGYLSFRKRIAR